MRGLGNFVLTLMLLSIETAAGAVRTRGEFSDLVTEGPWVDVRAYGAVSTDTDDDSAAVQAAIDTVEARLGSGKLGDGGVVYLPRGKYYVTGLKVSKFGVTLRGDGPEATYLVNTHPSNPLLTVALGAESTLGRFALKDLQFRNTVPRADGDHPLVFGDRLVDSRFDRVWFVSSPFKGDTWNQTKCDLMRLYGSFQLTFSDCVWWGAKGYGLDLTSGPQADCLVFSNCVWAYCGASVLLERGGSGSGANNVLFSGGKFLGWQGGAYIKDRADAWAKTAVASASGTGAKFSVVSATGFRVGRPVVIGADPDFAFAVLTAVNGNEVTVDRPVRWTMGAPVLHGSVGCVLGSVRTPAFRSMQFEGLDTGLYSLGGREILVDHVSLSNVSKGLYLANSFRYARVTGAVLATLGTPTNGVTWKFATLQGIGDAYNGLVIEDVDAEGSGYYDAAEGPQSLVSDLSGKSPSVQIRTRTNNRTATFAFPGLTVRPYAGASTGSIAALGAALGRFVRIAPPVDTSGVIVGAVCTGAGTITVTAYNTTGQMVNLPAGTWRFAVSED